MVAGDAQKRRPDQGTTDFVGYGLSWPPTAAIVTAAFRRSRRGVALVPRVSRIQRALVDGGRGDDLSPVPAAFGDRLDGDQGFAHDVPVWPLTLGIIVVLLLAYG